jgi:biopolymer transport protein ExbD
VIHNGLLSHTRHAKAGGGGHGPLSLVPMIDILMILVVYLLLHASDAELLANPRSVSMPMSVSDLKPREATLVTVTRDMLYVNGAAVIAVAEVGASAEPVVEILRAALDRPGGDAPTSDRATRELTVMAEKSLPYPVLRRIVASAAAAEYTKVSFAVVEREQAFAGRPGA